MASSKRYLFTLNNYTDEEYTKITNGLRPRCDYYIVGKEVGETGTPHLQGYCVFIRRCGFAKAKDYVSGRAHLEVARGTSLHNRTYCSKGGEYCEFGTLPVEHRSGGNPRESATRDDVAREFGTCLSDGRLGVGEFSRSRPGAWYYSGHSLLRNALAIAELRDRPDITVEWVYGKPGVGKSRGAHARLPNAYIKDPRTKWWNGYLLEHEVIIDDFGPNSIDINHLLRWFDRYKCYVETKGGMVPLHADVFIVTSNFTPTEVYTCNLGVEHPQLPALLRRIKIKELKYLIVSIGPGKVFHVIWPCAPSTGLVR
ncbi:MAG: replication associated protein [Arizlama virus AZLM_890]|nr:MAG: replication associated protein [Arizlama virus]